MPNEIGRGIDQFLAWPLSRLLKFVATKYSQRFEPLLIGLFPSIGRALGQELVQISLE